MKERLRAWLLRLLLGPYAHTLAIMPVQAGDFILVPGKNPERTGNTPTRMEVVRVEVRLCVDARYRDGSTTSFVMKPETLLRYMEAPRG